MRLQNNWHQFTKVFLRTVCIALNSTLVIEWLVLYHQNSIVTWCLSVWMSSCALFKYCLYTTRVHLIDLWSGDAFTLKLSRQSSSIIFTNISQFFCLIGIALCQIYVVLTAYWHNSMYWALVWLSFHMHICHGLYIFRGANHNFFMADLQTVFKTVFPQMQLETCKRYIGIICASAFPNAAVLDNID